MTAEEMEEWLLERPLVMGYMTLLFVGSLVAFIVLAIRIARSRRLDRPEIAPWQIAGLDFGLFLVALTLWFVLSGAILVEVYRWIAGPDAETGPGILVLGGLLLQGGMLYLFLRFRFHHRSPSEGPISPRIIGLPESLRLGFVYFLASLPIIYGVGSLWNAFLEFLRQRGYDVNLPLQDAVVLFQQARNPLVLAGLLLLAVVVAPIVEEAVFRAGIYRFLKGRISLPLALLISAALFGMVHGNLQSLPGLIAVGVCLGLAYEFSGNLRVPIFFHAFFNLNSIIWILILPETVVS